MDEEFRGNSQSKIKIYFFSEILYLVNMLGYSCECDVGASDRRSNF